MYTCWYCGKKNQISEKGENLAPKIEKPYLGDMDEMTARAVDIIRHTGKISATSLTRFLDIGFARAMQILEELEYRGIIGPQEGAKPRKIFI